MAYDSDRMLQRQKICRKCHSFITYASADGKNLKCPLCENPLPKPAAHIKPLSASNLIAAIVQHQSQVGPDNPLFYSLEAALNGRIRQYPFDDINVSKDTSHEKIEGGEQKNTLDTTGLEDEDPSANSEDNL